MQARVAQVLAPPRALARPGRLAPGDCAPGPKMIGSDSGSDAGWRGWREPSPLLAVSGATPRRRSSRAYALHGIRLAVANADVVVDHQRGVAVGGSAR
jgi:hypothetical protein